MTALVFSAVLFASRVEALQLLLSRGLLHCVKKASNVVIKSRILDHILVSLIVLTVS